MTFGMIDFENPTVVKVRKQMVQAISDYNMIEEGDRVLVCTSGGKDSTIMLLLLNQIRMRAPYKYEMEALLLDQKQPGFSADAFKAFVESHGIKLTVVERDTYSIVTEKVTNGVYCSLCSRLRRGILYDHAFDHGFTKMALGHHLDDLNETLLLNLFYTGRLAAMPPKLRSDDGRNILIRPLANVPESELIQIKTMWNFPIIPCNLCGSQEGMKRGRMKKLMTDLEKEIPNIRASMRKALGHVNLSQLADKDRWDFDAFHAIDRSESPEVLASVAPGGLESRASALLTDSV